MVYRSNLHAPDLRPQFKHLHSRVMGHSFGHDVLSDFADQDENGEFAFYKNCGLWTVDEAAILYQIALRVRGDWVDIGAHTGWTTAHIEQATGRFVYPIDPMHAEVNFRARFRENMRRNIDGGYVDYGTAGPSGDYFREKLGQAPYADGFCIDGDHEPGLPLIDAEGAMLGLKPGGVIVFHDFVGQPVRDAVAYLIKYGFRAKIYLTPHVVAVCWRPHERVFEPPFHVPEKGIVEQRLVKRWPERDWTEYL